MEARIIESGYMFEGQVYGQGITFFLEGGS